MGGSTDYGIVRDKEDARAVEKFLNPLPRSILRGNVFELLDGEWRFDFDLEDRGLNEKWFLDHDYSRSAVWPGSVESYMAEAKLAQEYTPEWQDQIVVWYERDFRIPDTWCRDSGCIVQVTFGACGYETRAWLNGHPLVTVEGEEVHFGEYTSFSYELPPEFLLWANRLTVRVADSLDAEIPRGKQNSQVYKRGGIWYQTYTGAARSVWLEPLERNRLRSRLNVVSSYCDRFVSFDITTRIRDPGMYTLRIVITPRGSDTPIAASDFKLSLEAGEKPQRVAVELPETRLWSVGEPNLYHIVIQLSNSREVLSQIETHFGLRTVEARGQSFYINDKALYLDGILYQPGSASFDQMRRHLLAIKQLGCNLIRVHISGIDPRIYDLADEIGMLLWVEVPSPHSSTQRSRKNHWAEMNRMLTHVGSHPSVVILSLYNEDWGAQDIAMNPETRQYIASTYDYLQLNHSQLLAIDNDGWHHLSIHGRLKTDLLTAHLYTADVVRWREILDNLIRGANEDVAAQPLIIGDPYFYVGQVPLVISEWGGFGFPDYGGPDTGLMKTEWIRSFKRELCLRPVAGDVYTQAVNIEDETNGLIDRDSGELSVAPSILRFCKVTD